MIVSSLLLQTNGQTTHGVGKYLERFNHLVNLGIPILFFVDRAISLPSYPWWIRVERVRLSETKTYQKMKSVDAVLPEHRNPSKDTFDYLAIINAKTELMSRALEMCDAERLSWVDSGIAHVLKKPESLHMLHQVHRLPDGIVLPGPNWTASVPLDRIHWRFCGGFFTGDRSSLRLFCDKAQSTLADLLPKATWEVNLWAYMESQGFPFIMYCGDHNDSIFNFHSLLPEEL